jgi:lipopolysaccharide transport system ATP-binding protein
MRRREIDARFDEIVAFAQIDKFLDTMVKRYSSGMYLRLAFAVAAHLDPEILIVDEVLAVGDANFQKKCLGKMDDVTKSGRTVLLVTHSMPMISQLCEHAILLTNGRLNKMGPAQEVIESYNAMCGVESTSK